MRRDIHMTPNEGLIRIFEYALQQEETGKSFFETSLQRLGWGAALSAFTRLIQEEEKHIHFIKNILRGLRESGAGVVVVGKVEDLPASDFFDERARREFLDQMLIETMIPDVTVFNVAWLIEKDLSEFYEKMAAKTGGKAAEALQMLADWEKRHELFFREYRDRLVEEYSKMPWGG
jgi:rubrerythrin